jgi:hypothetical protein
MYAIQEVIYVENATFSTVYIFSLLNYKYSAIL